MDRAMLQRLMTGLIEEVCRTIGPRPPGSAAEAAGAALIRARLAEHCDRTASEPFEHAPAAFLGCFKVWFVLAALGYLAFWVYAPLAALFLVAASAVVGLEFLRYREALDRYYPRAAATNVLGELEPNSPARSTVIVAGHVDSAYEFGLWYRLGTAGLYVQGLALVHAAVFVVPAAWAGWLWWGQPALAAAAGRPWWRGLSGLAGSDAGGALLGHLGWVAATLPSWLWWWGLAALLVALPLGLTLYFLHGQRAVPGASDNLSAVAVALGVAAALRARALAGQGLRRTRVRCLAFGAEEAGLRGSRRYVRRHHEALLAERALLINLDSIRAAGLLALNDRELMPGARHHAGMMALLDEQRRVRGQAPLARHTIPMGGTDASAFSLAGLPAVSLTGISLDRLDPTYHTRRDTPEHVEPAALVEALDLALDFIVAWDERAHLPDWWQARPLPRFFAVAGVQVDAPGDRAVAGSPPAPGDGKRPAGAGDRVVPP